MVEYVSISAWVNAQKGKQDTLVRKVVLDIDKSVSKRSPVDTGRFKGNWMLGENYQPSGKNENKFDTKPLGVVGDTVGEHVDNISLKAAGNVYYLVNNLEYANELENGKSGQAPNGMVGLTITQFDAIIEKDMAEVT